MFPLAAYMAAPSSSPSLVTTVLTALSSGALVALVNTGFAFYKDNVVFKRQKLEELHRAVFFIHARSRISLFALSEYFGFRREIEKLSDVDTRRAGLAACDLKLQAIISDVPVDELTRSLEGALSIISIHYRDLRDARAELNDVTQRIISLVLGFTPNMRIAGEESSDVYMKKLLDEVNDVGAGLLRPCLQA
jgi:hypothetical protein